MFKEVYCVRVYENFGAERIEELGWLAKSARGGGRYDGLAGSRYLRKEFASYEEADKEGAAFIKKTNADNNFLPFLYSVEYQIA